MPRKKSGVEDDIEEVQEVKVVITLHAPTDMKSEHWSREECIHDYVDHWLEEGYYASDHSVELPEGISYKGFELKFGKKFKKKVEEI